MAKAMCDQRQARPRSREVQRGELLQVKIAIKDEAEHRARSREAHADLVIGKELRALAGEETRGRRRAR